MSDLVERLRGRYPVGKGDPPEFGIRQFEVPAIQREAADTIESLRARVEKLGKQLDLVLADARRYALADRGDDVTGLKDLLRQWLVYESSRELRAATLDALGMRTDPTSKHCMNCGRAHVGAGDAAACQAITDCAHEWFRLSSWPVGQFRCYSCGQWQNTATDEAGDGIGNR